MKNRKIDFSNLNGDALSKVPEVTLVFWIIKIAATTLGETGGDTVTMTFNGAIWQARFSLRLCLYCW
jgi:uncharacterized membrane-anchored protein